MAYDENTGYYIGYIYCITNIKNNKKYIGKTVETIEKRYKRHLYEALTLKTDYYLYRAIRKYGKNNFIVEKIDEIRDTDFNRLKENIFTLETNYILKYDTYKNGYNEVVNGKGNGSICDKTVYKYNIEDGRLIEEYASSTIASIDVGVNVSCISSACSMEQKTAGGFLWSYGLYDIHPLAGFKKEYDTTAVDQYTLKGEYIRTYGSITIAEKMTGIKNISGVCRHAIKSAGDYIWTYHNEPPVLKNKPKTKRVYQYNISGGLLKIFESSKLAAQEMGVANSCIVACCNKKVAISCGYVWRYEGDCFSLIKFETPKYYRKVNMYTVDGIYIRTYETISEAAKENNIHGANITKVCKNQCKTAGGYKWYYANDPNQPDKTKIIN